MTTRLQDVSRVSAQFIGQLSSGDVIGVKWPYRISNGVREFRFEIRYGTIPELWNNLNSRMIAVECSRQHVILTVSGETVSRVPGLIVDGCLITDAYVIPDECRVLGVSYVEMVRDGRTAVLHGYVIGGRLIKHCKLEHAKELYAQTIIAKRLRGITV